MQPKQNLSVMQPKKTYYVLRPLNASKNTPSNLALIKKFVQQASKRGELSYYRLPDYGVQNNSSLIKKDELFNQIKDSGYSIENEMLFGWDFVRVGKPTIIPTIHKVNNVPQQRKVINIVYSINGGEIHPLELDAICSSFKNAKQINLLVLVGLDYKQKPYSNFDRDKEREILLNKIINCNDFEKILKIPYIYICEDSSITFDEELIELELDRIEKKAISREYQKFKSYFIKTQWNFNEHDLVVSHKNMLEETINFIDLPPYYYKH